MGLESIIQPNSVVNYCRNWRRHGKAIHHVRSIASSIDGTRPLTFRVSEYFLLRKTETEGLRDRRIILECHRLTTCNLVTRQLPLAI